MIDSLYTIAPSIDATARESALPLLESGKVLFCPHHAFTVTQAEQALLSETILAPKHKNISYDHQRQRIAGVKDQALTLLAQAFMHRFAEFAKELVDTVLPRYSDTLHWGRTSYRPAEIKGRKTSKRKDDTRVHVDAFAATPVNGLRILRVFSNINPYEEPRVWHLGEPFSNVLQKFAPHIPRYSRHRAKLLNLIHATKTLRSPYDHYMLHLHDQMKLNESYQQKLRKTRVDFPSQSSWIVFTDHVSHAALSGQFLLEQTFYLPVSAMANPSHSPLKQWQAIRVC